MKVSKKPNNTKKTPEKCKTVYFKARKNPNFVCGYCY